MVGVLLLCHAKVTSHQAFYKVLQWVCLYVCCLLAYLRNNTSKLHKIFCAQNFLYVLPVALAWSSFDRNAVRYVQVPVLQMTSSLPVMGHTSHDWRACNQRDLLEGSTDSILLLVGLRHMLKVKQQRAALWAKSWCLRLPCVPSKLWQLGDRNLNLKCELFYTVYADRFQ